MNDNLDIEFDKKETEKRLDIKEPVALLVILMETKLCDINHFYLKAVIHRKNKTPEVRQFIAPRLQSQTDTAYFIQTANSNEIANLEAGDWVILSVMPQRGFEYEEFDRAVVRLHYSELHQQVANNNLIENSPGSSKGIGQRKISYPVIGIAAVILGLGVLLAINGRLQ